MLILKNATVVQFDGSPVEEGIDVVIENGEITFKGKPEEQKNNRKTDEAEIIDCSNKVVTPGLVCSHNHFYSVLARGITVPIDESNDFVSVLKNLWWRLDRALDDETVYYSGMVGALEAIKAGTTAVIDHHASPSSISGSLRTLGRAFKEVGLRGILAYEVTDRNGMKGMEAGIRENIDFVGSLLENSSGLLEAAIGAHAPFTLSEKSMEMLGEAVKSTGRGIHIHLCEDTYDGSVSHHLYGEDVTARLERFDLLNERAILVHGVYLTDGDVERINKHDSFLVHNARSNMNNSVGYNEKLPLYRNVALGTDGIGSDMIEEMKIACFKHRDAGGKLWPPDFLSFLDNGNRILERYFGQRFGKIEKGSVADITVFDYVPPTPLVSENIAGHMVFGGLSGLVDTVIVGGKVVLKNGEYTIKTDNIFREARKAAEKMWKRMEKIK